MTQIRIAQDTCQDPWGASETTFTLLNESTTTALRSCILMMTRLELLWMNGRLIDNQLLLHLSSLHTLSYLYIEPDSGLSLSHTPPDVQSHPFLHLHHITLSLGMTPNSVALFSSLVSPAPRLERLTVPWSYHSMAEETLEIIRSMLTSVHSFPLECITFRASEGLVESVRSNDNSSRLIFAPNAHICLQPSLALSPTLRELELGIHAIFLLSNVFMGEFARGLPHLERLILTPEWTAVTDFLVYAETTDVMTLDGLLPLVDYCPKLTQLRIAVHSAFSTGFNHGSRRRGGVKTTAILHTLELWTTVIKVDDRNGHVVDQTGAFLFDAFPWLTHFNIGVCTLVQPSRAKVDISLEEVELARNTWERILDDMHGLYQQARRQVERQ